MEQRCEDSCGGNTEDFLKITAFLETTGQLWSDTEDHLKTTTIVQIDRTAVGQHRKLSEGHNLHPNHSRALAQHGRPFEDCKLRPNSPNSRGATQKTFGRSQLSSKPLKSFGAARRTFWRPQPLSKLTEQPWGNAEDLPRTTAFVQTSGLTI